MEPLGSMWGEIIPLELPPAIPRLERPTDLSTEQHQLLQERTGHMGGASKVDESYRLFMVPGMAHCSGGDGPNQFDTIGALEQWVEKGKPPGQIIASRIRDGKTAARYGFCHFGYFMCSSSMGPPSLSEGILARQRILDCAKVGKGKRTVSDLGVGSYAQGALPKRAWR
jgi:hypothetical protein